MEDEITVKQNGAMISLTMTYHPFTSIGLSKNPLSVSFSGPSVEEVEGWVDVAKANQILDKRDWGKTPIIIN